jgi:hypothetical protein
MVDQQPDIELGARQLRDRQHVEALAQRRPGDRDRIDDIGFAALTRRSARAGHQFRRHTHDLLAAAKQEALQRPGDVSAVLDRPDTLCAQAARPHEQVIERAALGLDRAVGERPAGRDVDRAEGVRVLVGVRPDHDHLHRRFVGNA